jgi:hypothetical protein
MGVFGGVDLLEPFTQPGGLLGAADGFLSRSLGAPVAADGGGAGEGRAGHPPTGAVSPRHVMAATIDGHYQSDIILIGGRVIGTTALRRRSR